MNICFNKIEEIMFNPKWMILFTSTIIVSFSVNTKNELEDKIKEHFKSVEGNYALAFKLIGSEKSILINENEMFHAASTMKTPVMIEAFKQDANEVINLQDSLIVKNSFKSIIDNSEFSLDISRDSDDKMYSLIGKKETYYNLVYDMIIGSSNLATNIVIEKLGAKNVMKTMDELGAKSIKVLRGVEDMKAFDAGLNNETSANDLLVLFEKIAQGKAVNSKSDSTMIKILLDQKHNDIIPYYLPKDVKVAHKGGSISGVLHDSGIVFLPDGRKYVLVILSKNITNEEKSREMMAEVSKLIYEFVISQ